MKLFEYHFLLMIKDINLGIANTEKNRARSAVFVSMSILNVIYCIFRVQGDHSACSYE